MRLTNRGALMNEIFWSLWNSKDLTQSNNLNRLFTLCFLLFTPPQIFPKQCF